MSPNNRASVTTLIAAQQLGFSYGAESVLEHVNFECCSGEFVAVLGASGCGKSTLLRLVAGLIQPTQGDLQIEGQPAATRRDCVSFVFQRPTLCPWRSVQANVELPLQLGHQAPATRAQAARDAIRLVGLRDDDAEKIPRELSGGMQMRVSLARALITRPQVMLLDEPFSALDEVLRQQLGEKTRELWGQESWTTLMVTHSVEEAVFMSQRVLILAGHPARIVEDVEIPFDERTARLRTTPQFVQLVAEIAQSLRRAVES